MKTLMKAFACLLLLAGLAIQSRAASLDNAGTLQAVLDPTGQTPGYVLSNGIPNTGTMGGVWAVVPTNTARLSNTVVVGPSVITEPGGRAALLFDDGQTNAFSTWTANQQSGGTNLPAPATLVGVSPTYSVEVWAMAPTLSAYSTMVTWGSTSTSSNEFSFNYGTSDGNVGGALNLGANVLNWGSGGPPAAGVYHHLVTTFDGTTVSLYCDGVLLNQSANLQGGTSFAPLAGYPINVGSSRSSSSGTAGEAGSINSSIGGSSGSAKARMHIGKVRIMDGVLTLAQITNNYLVDLPNFALTPSTLSHTAIHDWIFNGGAGDASGQTISDSGSLHGAAATIYSTFSPGYPAGSATFKTTSLPQGTYLHLDGGSATNGAYVDLGTNLINSMSAFVTNNGLTAGSIGYNSTHGYTGQLTVEGWLTVKGHPNYWQTYFAFGDTTATNNTPANNVVAGRIIGLAAFGQNGPGGLSSTAAQDGQITGNTSGYQGINFWLFQQNNTDTGSTKMDMNGNPDNFYGGYSNGIATPVSDKVFIEYAENQKHPFSFTHYASSWNESNNEVVNYINGLEMGRNITDKKMYMIYDRNDWLGRDFYFANPTLEGDYYEFRIYSNILSPAEVLGSYEAGPSLTNTVNLGAPSALHFVETTASSNWVGSRAYFQITADYGVTNGLNVTANGVTYSNSAPAVVGVTAGMLNFLSAGTATIQATYGGQTATLSLTVAPLAATLTHRLSFGSDSFGAPFDSITQSYPPGSYGYVGSAAGTGNGVLITNGAANASPGWIDMGPNWISPTYDGLTVEAWASFYSPSGTSPLFSFGDQRVNEAGLLSNLNGNGFPNGALPMAGRYAIEAYTSPNAQIIWSADDPMSSSSYGVTKSGALNGSAITGTNVQHFVAEYNPTGGFARVYVNGVPAVATNQYLPLLDTLVDNYNYIGLSVNSGYRPSAPGNGPIAPPNPIGGGTVGTNNMFLYEFRTYNGILAQSNVEIDLAVGPTIITNNIGALTNISLTTPNSLLVSQSGSAVLLGNFQYGSNVNMFYFDTNASISSSSNAILTVNSSGTITGVSGGSANVIASYPGFTPITNSVEIVSLTPVLKHEWSFITTNNGAGGVNLDSVTGLFNATNVGNAHVVAGQGLILTTNGPGASTDYEALPPGIIDPTNYVVLTVEAWASFTNHKGVLAPYAPLYSFGSTNAESNAAYYVKFIPHSDDLAPSFANPNSMLTINGTDPGALPGPEQGFNTIAGAPFFGNILNAAGLGENNAFGTPVLDGLTNVQIVGIYHPFGGYMQLYVNGALAGTNALSSTAPTALQLVQDNLSYLGRNVSVTSDNTNTISDYLDGTIQEFRLYSGLFGLAQIAMDYATGPILSNRVNVTTAPDIINTVNGVNFDIGSPVAITSITVSNAPTALFHDGAVPAPTVYASGSNSQNQTFHGLSLSGAYVTNTVGGPNSGVDGPPTFVSSNPGVVQVVGANLIARQPGTTTITASYVAFNPGYSGFFGGPNYITRTYSWPITVSYSPGAVQLVHHYNFDEPANSTVAHDSVGHIDATLHYTAKFNGLGQMQLDGQISNNASGPDDFSYAVTGPGLIAGLSNATFEGWILVSNQVNAGRFFETGAPSDSTAGGTTNDIGITNCYINFLDDEGGGANPLGASIKPTNSGVEYDTVFVEGPAGVPILTNVFNHVVLVVDQSANQGKVYTNGVLASTNLGTMVAYIGQVNDYTTYFGRSHYVGTSQGTGVNNGSVDPPTPGVWDEFRVWNAAMDSNQVYADYLAGPNTISSPSLTMKTNGNGTGILITYPYYATRTWTLASSANLLTPVTSWTPVVATPTTNVSAGVLTSVTVPVPIGAGNQFFILK